MVLNWDLFTIGTVFSAPSRTLSRDIFWRSAVRLIPLANSIMLSRFWSSKTSYFAGLYTAPSIATIDFLASTKTTSPDLNRFFILYWPLIKRS